MYALEMSKASRLANNESILSWCLVTQQLLVNQWKPKICRPFYVKTDLYCSTTMSYNKECIIIKENVKHLSIW